MIRSVLPANSSRQRWLQDGHAENEVRLPTLEETEDPVGEAYHVES